MEAAVKTVHIACANTHTHKHIEWCKALGSREHAYKGLLDMRTTAWCIALNSAPFISFFSCNSACFLHNHLIQLPPSATFTAQHMLCMIAFLVAVSCSHVTMRESEGQYVPDKLCIIIMTWYICVSLYRCVLQAYKQWANYMLMAVTYSKRVIVISSFQPLYPNGSIFHVKQTTSKSWTG